MTGLSAEEKAEIDASMAVLLLNLILEGDLPGYAFVAMPAAKVPDFFTDFANAEVEWPEYVHILHQGEGDTPPEEVRAWIYDTYGFES